MERHIVAALTAELLDQACALWVIPRASLQLIRDYENFVYDVTVEERRAVLRITYAGHRDQEALEAELEFIRVLAQTGIHVCMPRRSVAGLWVEALGDDFHVCCFEYAPGVKTSWRNPLVWHERTFINWGRLLAHLHDFSASATPPSGRRRSFWMQDDLIHTVYLSPQDNDIAIALAQIVSELQCLPTDASRFGLIHADVHQGNFFTSQEGQLALFDFDDACYHWYSYDLAVVFYHLSSGDAEADGRPSRRQIARLIMDGYRQIRELPPGFFADLPRFLRLRDLQMYQALFKKTAPDDRQPWWFHQAAQTAARIRSGQVIIDVSQ